MKFSLRVPVRCSVIRPCATAVALAFAVTAQAAPAETDTAADTEASAGQRLPSVLIVGQRAANAVSKEGTSEDGYKSSTTAIAGPLGNATLQDTPYSVNVVPRELIENLQATSTDDIFRVNPFTQVTTLAGRNTSTFVNIRGFNVSNKTLDGMQTAVFQEDAVEDKERVEVFSGLSGFLYGAASPGGTINYVLKRPTPEQFIQVTAGDLGGSSGYGHIDVGGPIDSAGRFGYRINLVRQDGETAIDKQHQTRNLASAAFDWRIAPRALLQLDFSHSEGRLDGVPAAFVGLGSATVPYPATVPRNDLLWSQPWTFTRNQMNEGGLRFTWDLTDTTTLRTAYEKLDSKVDFTTFQTGQFDSSYRYRPFVGGQQYPESKVDSGSAYLDQAFETGSLQHKVTVGYLGTSLRLFTNVNFSQNCLSPSGTIGFANCTALASSPFNLSNPLYIPIPDNFYTTPNGNGQVFLSSTTKNQNAVIADTVSWGEQWQLLFGVSRTNITVDSYSAPGASRSSYDKSAWTPSASLLFKPISWITTYATYIQGLEQGQIVSSNYSNAGAVLPPLRSKQYELGAKADTGKVLWTAALFYIDKPNQFSDNAIPVPTFVQDGREVHKGGELSATGKVTEDLTLVGGVTVFDAKVQKANDPTLEGKRPVAVSEQTAKAYLEYRLPFWHPLLLTGGITYFGDFAVNATNTAFLPPVTTVDLGARYEMAVASHPLIFRFSATNVAGRDYWITNGQLGNPRTFAFSGTVRF